MEYDRNSRIFSSRLCLSLCSYYFHLTTQSFCRRIHFSVQKYILSFASIELFATNSCDIFTITRFSPSLAVYLFIETSSFNTSRNSRLRSSSREYWKFTLFVLSSRTIFERGRTRWEEFSVWSLVCIHFFFFGLSSRNLCSWMDDDMLAERKILNARVQSQQWCEQWLIERKKKKSEFTTVYLRGKQTGI